MEKVVKEGVGIVGHTPGPWKAKAKSAEFTDNCTVIQVVEVVLPTERISLLEFDANAHLIAAAPEMYEALKNWLDVFSRFSPGHELRVLAIEEAQKVLAKAEGKK